MFLYNKAYVITEECLNMIAAKYESFNASDHEEDTLESFLRRQDSNKALEIQNGVAIIRIQGVLEKRLSLFSLFFGGGVSTESIKVKLDQAIRIDKVQRIILDIDSPGGEVDGILELTQMIFTARDKKPIISFVNEMAASGGYWIASAGSQIVINGKFGESTAQCGSVGVVAMHRDISKNEEMHGVKTTEIVSTFSPFKRAVSPHKALDKTGETELLRKVNELYTIMTNNIGKYLGISGQSVQRNFGDGRMYIGKDCITRGMATSIDTLQDLIARNSINSGKFKIGEKKVEFQLKDLTLEFITQHAPNVIQSIQQKAVSSVVVDKTFVQTRNKELLTSAYNEGFGKGCKTERERIQGIENVVPVGMESISEKYKYDGKTSASEVAMHILTEQKTNRNTNAGDLQGESQSATHVENDQTKKAEVDAEEMKNIVQFAKSTEGIAIVGQTNRASWIVQ